jgi:type II secretory pathway pseudopilin PulG
MNVRGLCVPSVCVEIMKLSRHFQRAAFTLIEAMVAIGIFGVYAGVGVTALIRMNTNAALSRLQTGASTAAQGQIDLCLSDQPFNPQLTDPQTGKPEIPAELTIGATNYYGASTPTVAQKNSGSAANPLLPVYTDPTSGATINGWMTTTVADTLSTNNGSTLYVYSITVTVYYNYRNKLHSVTMWTLRASDS